MARESDNIHVAALALAVGLPIGIENCQQSGELTRIEFPAQPPDSTGVDGLVGTEVGSPSGEAKMTGIDSRSSPILPRSPPVTLLYRPGHYDILYSK
ncbi:hypothetical protein AHF37_02634 [Paragonimus kellicotti]|nr:hypothetical protein AHF37_02634 [Paragonimus kellicotti]